MTRSRVVAGAVVVVAAASGFFGARALAADPEWVVERVRRPPDLARHGAAILAASKESGVDADLLRGLVAAESGGDPKARSGAGAVGLAQLLPGTAADQARALRLDPARLDLEDPATNLRLGARYLRTLLDSFDGDESSAIAAYNAGSKHVRRWRLRAPDVSAAEAVRREAYAETRTHVERVLRYRDSYRSR